MTSKEILPFRGLAKHQVPIHENVPVAGKAKIGCKCKDPEDIEGSRGCPREQKRQEDHWERSKVLEGIDQMLLLPGCPKVRYSLPEPDEIREAKQHKIQPGLARGLPDKKD